ncbi:UNVERIFIED_CONTAM: hypothetical protein GTU68_005876 [Idotea baltica]|nr:hypothetical protein [Idotea baltica]
MSSKHPYEYDLLVIGSGPSGQKAAVQAAKLNKKVAVIEKNHDLGGVCTNTGTIPSKSFREAVLYLTGFRERSLYGSAYCVKSRISMADLTYRISTIVQQEIEIIDDQLRRNSIDVLFGSGYLLDKHNVQITDNEGKVSKTSAQFIVIAVGTFPHHPEGFDLNHPKVHDSDRILTLEEIPSSLTVVGGGIIGCEYASWFSLLGIKVTLIEARDELLTFADTEVVDILVEHLENMGMDVLLGSGVKEVNELDDGQLETKLDNEIVVVSDSVLISAGRQGATYTLGLENAGIEIAKYGRLKVDENFQTSVPNVYAVGDVIGFPALASSGMLQGRAASMHMFGLKEDHLNIPLPYGIWTIPEISMVGATEKALIENNVPFEVGRARYREIARGMMIGDEEGLLKLLFHKETLKILGIHIIGEGATEILHLGQAVLHLGGTLQYFTSGVFNYPTLGECYRVAALDGFNKINNHTV